MFRKRIFERMILIVGIIFVGTIAIGFTACDFLFGSNDDEDDNGSNAEYGWYGNGSSSNFTINNSTQLKGFSKIVSGETGNDGPRRFDFKGKTVTLAADINMNGINWVGIGADGWQGYHFNGTFDGNNKTISGLSRNGFFGWIGEGGIVKNMVIVDLNANETSGGLARQNYGRIQNISITGSAKNGGVVGNNYGIVENCNFSGTISAEYRGGGIAIGNQNGGVIRNCYVTGSVSGGNLGTGGIVNDNFGVIENCYSTCSVTNTFFASSYTGGIAGSNMGTVKNCYSTGDISGTDHVGGIAGSNSENGKIQNCYTTGNVAGEYIVGGILGSAGSSNGGTVQNCVALSSSITETQINTFGVNRGHIGRITGSSSNTLSLINNYFGSNGSFQTLVTVTVTSNTNGIHGADVDISDYNTQTWWITNLNWDFNTIWQWDSAKNLPKLR
jgi:hypothetical protein